MLKNLSFIAAIFGSTLSAYFISQNSTNLAFYSIFVLVLIIEAMKYLAYPTALSNILSIDILKKVTGSFLLILAMAISTVSAYSQYSRISADLVHNSNLAQKESEIISKKISNLELTIAKSQKEVNQLLATNQKTKAAAIEVNLNKNTQELEQLIEQRDALEMKTIRQLSNDYTNIIALVIAISVELFPVLLLILSGKRELSKVSRDSLDEYLLTIQHNKRVFSTDVAKAIGISQEEALAKMSESQLLKRVGRYFVRV